MPAVRSHLGKERAVTSPAVLLCPRAQPTSTGALIPDPVVAVRLRRTHFGVQVLWPSSSVPPALGPTPNRYRTAVPYARTSVNSVL